MAVVLLLYGAGMMAVILWGDHVVGVKMLNVFGIMFSGIVGLGSGYLLGKRNGGANS